MWFLSSPTIGTTLLYQELFKHPNGKRKPTQDCVLHVSSVDTQRSLNIHTRPQRNVCGAALRSSLEIRLPCSGISLKTCPQSKVAAVLSHEWEQKCRRYTQTHYSKEQPVACFKIVKSCLYRSLQFDIPLYSQHGSPGHRMNSL